MKEPETPENLIPAGRPKRARLADRRIRPGARFRPAVGGRSQGFGPKTAKTLIFTVFRCRPSISRAWRKRFAFLRNLNCGGSDSTRAPNTGAVKVSIALAGVESLSRTPSNENVAAVTTPRKALADSLNGPRRAPKKRQEKLSGTPSKREQNRHDRLRKGLTDSLMGPRGSAKRGRGDPRGLSETRSKRPSWPPGKASLTP